MEPTQKRNFRSVERWNSVVVPPEVALRALNNIDVDQNGCWVSRYSVASHGYAQVGWSIRKTAEPGGRRNQMVLAHRAAWTAVHGQVPLGMTLDHICKVRRCVNPTHLRLLPNYENARRIDGADWPIGTCKHGHTAEWLVPVRKKTKSGEPRMGVVCSVCRREHQKRWAMKNHEKNLALQAAYRARKKACNS